MALLSEYNLPKGLISKGKEQRWKGGEQEWGRLLLWPCSYHREVYPYLCQLVLMEQ